MRNLRLLPVLLILLLGAAHAQEMMTTTRVDLVLTPRTNLTSDVKEKLDGSSADQGGIQVLVGETLVKVIQRQNFTTRVTINKNGQPVSESRQYTAVYVEVTEGENQGARGWMVEQYVKGNGQKRKYLSPPRQQAVARPQPDAPADGADLALSVSKDDSTYQVAGKRVYSISVSNLGNQAVTNSFMVRAVIGSRTLKRERVRGLQPGSSHYFNVEVPEENVRRRDTLLVEVDPERAVEESDENNNQIKQKLY